MNGICLNTELERIAQRDDNLYDKFAKHLEAEHPGEFVVINHDGQLILSKDDIYILQTALKKFGSGNFAFQRIGSKTLGKWRIKIGN
jgi:hypothetical protein